MSCDAHECLGTKRDLEPGDRSVVWRALMIGLGALVWGFTAGSVHAHQAAAQLAADGMLTVAGEGFYEHAVLTVAGPAGYWLELDLDAGDQVTVDLLHHGRLGSSAAAEPLTRLPNGSYRYELIAVDAEDEVSVTQGRFIVRGGLAGDPPGSDTASEHDGPKNASGLQTIRSETLIPDGVMQVVNPAPTSDAVFSLGISTLILDNNVWNMSHEAPTGDLHLEAADSLTPGNGDTRLYIDRSSGAIGVNTSTPGASFEIDVLAASGTSDLRLRSSFGSRLHLDSLVADFDLTSGLGNAPQFTVRDSSGTDLFVVEEGGPASSLVIDAAGRVGVGTNAPTAPLTVEGSSGEASIRVEEIASNAAVEVMLNLVCDCAPGFRMKNSANGVTWFFRHTSAGDFTFDNLGGSGLEARLDTNGSLFLKGSLSQGSSRSLKENLVPANGESVLTALAGLELYEWSYVDQDSRHFGPMAEDFSAAYGLGSSSARIAPADMAGLALAASKTLVERNEALAARSDALEVENEQLKTQLRSVLERLEALERRDE